MDLLRAPICIGLTGGADATDAGASSPGATAFAATLAGVTPEIAAPTAPIASPVPASDAASAGDTAPVWYGTTAALPMRDDHAKAADLHDGHRTVAVAIDDTPFADPATATRPSSPADDRETAAPLVAEPASVDAAPSAPVDSEPLSRDPAPDLPSPDDRTVAKSVDPRGQPVTVAAAPATTVAPGKPRAAVRDATGSADTFPQPVAPGKAADPKGGSRTVAVAAATPDESLVAERDVAERANTLPPSDDAMKPIDPRGGSRTLSAAPAATIVSHAPGVVARDPLVLTAPIVSADHRAEKGGDLRDGRRTLAARASGAAPSPLAVAVDRDGAVEPSNRHDIPAVPDDDPDTGATAISPPVTIAAAEDEPVAVPDPDRIAALQPSPMSATKPPSAVMSSAAPMSTVASPIATANVQPANDRPHAAPVRTVAGIAPVASQTAAPPSIAASAAVPHEDLDAVADPARTPRAKRSEGAVPDTVSDREAPSPGARFAPIEAGTPPVAAPSVGSVSKPLLPPIVGDLTATPLAARISPVPIAATGVESPAPLPSKSAQGAPASPAVVPPGDAEIAAQPAVTTIADAVSASPLAAEPVASRVQPLAGRSPVVMASLPSISPVDPPIAPASPARPSDVAATSHDDDRKPAARRRTTIETPFPAVAAPVVIVAPTAIVTPGEAPPIDRPAVATPAARPASAPAAARDPVPPPGATNDPAIAAAPALSALIAIARQQRPDELRDTPAAPDAVAATVTMLAARRDVGSSFVRTAAAAMIDTPAVPAPTRVAPVVQSPGPIVAPMNVETAPSVEARPAARVAATTDAIAAPAAIATVPASPRAARARTPVRAPETDAGIAPATPAAAAVVSPAATAATAPSASGMLAANGADRQVEVARHAAWADGIARDIADAGATGGTARFTIAPATLGAVAVEIGRSADGATVRLVASSVAARDALDAARPQLVAEARAQGLHIHDARIDLAGRAGNGADGHRDVTPHQPVVTASDQPRSAESVDTNSLTTGAYGGAGGGEAGRQAQQHARQPSSLPQTDRAAAARPSTAPDTGAVEARRTADGRYA